ncbi:MAG TPA: siroheme synthase CysG [Nevskiaceae bacterium]|nr:siroheme synthase CysG [Nevskiaceae bacterium]
MEFFPAFLRLRGRPVLVIGAGEVALRKVRLLQKAGASVQLVARELHPELAAEVAAGRLRHLAADYCPSQLDGQRLLVAASSDARLNRRAAADAEALGLWANVVDDPAPSTFITPALIDREPLLLAIGTGGSAPVLARRLRERLEAELPARLGELARFLGERRERLPAPRRRRLTERFLDGPGAEAVLRGDLAEAERQLDTVLAEAPRGGEVYLVGAGPGDPDLLTFRALRLMQQCDVVLHDALIPPAILDLVRRDAERVDVGKRRARHTLPQEAINAELLARARAGQRVLRLKGGDPFVFGRGGEEIEGLAAAGIPFQVVPGITAANGCAAYAGIPLTHRDHAQSVVFVTGHRRADGALDLNWAQLVQPRQTVVIYMGRSALAELCARLLEHGLAPAHPAALVEQGSTPRQRVLVAPIAELPARAETFGGEGPSLVILGSVVTLRERLAWFTPDRPM